MSKKTKLICIGNVSLNNQSLNEDFDYVEIAATYNFCSDPLMLEVFTKERINPIYERAIFIIAKDALILKHSLELIKQLPAHQIIYDIKVKISKEVDQILKLKGARSFDLTNKQALVTFLLNEYTTKQEGYKLPNDFLKVHSNFTGEVKKQGNSYINFTGEFTTEFQQIASWKMSTIVSTTDRFEVFPEFEILDDNIELLYKFFLISENGQEIVNIVEATSELIASNQRIIIENPKSNAIMNIAIYAKGQVGSIRIGAMHIRRALSDSIMIPGGRKISDIAMMNSELFYYFNAGDLKPPLAVYFSGYRSAEGFEGRGMMSGMRCPYMLIGDPRLEGGNFYLGNQEFEQQLVKIILEKLEALGFTQSDLILSGLSMGTFGSLYYAADLTPGAIIVGKPLVNIGTIALNEKINRPGGFPTSLDMLFYNTGCMSPEAAKELNQRFWNKFELGNYSNTVFAIAYMQHDDYDKFAFKQLFDVIKTKDARTKILYKGLIGRHNDNSPAINAWFLKQYRNIMLTKFGRKNN